MKAFVTFVFLCCCFAIVNLFAQTPKAVEGDLLKWDNRIDYWEQYINEQRDTTDAAAKKVIAGEDSLEKANDVFGDKLKFYTNKYPFTISQNFKKLDIIISTSTDGKFRIYSWDTEMGGTEHDFRNVMQYKNGKGVRSVLNMDTSANIDDNYEYYFSKIYTLTANDKTYYLGIYNGIFSTKDMEEGVQIFCIENGKLNTRVKLIKTASGLHNKLSYDYDYFSIPKKLKNVDIHYNPALKTLTIPVVGADDHIGEDEKVSTKRIIYKFTGQYFERVKN